MMEACASRLCVNIYRSVYRKIYIRPSRCLCTKEEDKSGSSDAPLSESDAKVNQNVSGDRTHPSSKDESGNAVQSETIRFHKSSSKAKDGSQGNENQHSQAKLLSVLSDIKVSGTSTGSTKFNLNLARPTKRLGRKKEKIDEVEAQLRMSYGDGMPSAVKAVASDLGGDVEKTEQELVQSLISPDKELQPEEPEVLAKKSTELEDAKGEPNVSEDMMSAIGAAASSVVGDPVKTESELTKKLLSIVERTFEPVDMSEVVEGMRVDKKKRGKDVRAQQIMQPRTLPRAHRRVIEHQVDLFSGTPLNVFKLENEGAGQESPCLMLWDELQKKELQSLVQYAPSNPYEEMIQWTKQGKFWTFPINNEAGMYEEENVGFHEHVFLDDLLEGFPENRSIRLFMELVITGLSKNPYISVERKAEHVAWYREYFEQNKEILKQYEDTN